jgi:hypothetical protein
MLGVLGAISRQRLFNNPKRHPRKTHQSGLSHHDHLTTDRATEKPRMSTEPDMFNDVLNFDTCLTMLKTAANTRLPLDKQE